MPVLAQMACSRFACNLSSNGKFLKNIAYIKSTRLYRYLIGLYVNCSLNPRNLSERDLILSRSLEPCSRITFPFAESCKIIKILLFFVRCLRIFLCGKHS